MIDYQALSKAQLIEQLQQIQSRLPPIQGDESAQELLHQLQVQQVELEAQNQELRSAQIALVNSRDQYAELYDFAPVGYLTLDSRANITEINLTGAALLGKERARVLNSDLSHYLVTGERGLLNAYVRRAFTSGRREVVELRFAIALHDNRIFRLEAVRQVSDERVCLRLSMTDVTELRLAEDVRRKQASENAALQTRDKIKDGLARLSAAVAGTFDPDDMLHKVADVVRVLFQSDRAWLLYPCDAQTNRVTIKVESTSPAYPGAGAYGEEMRFNHQEDSFIRQALQSDAPITECLPGRATSSRYQIASQMIMAIRPHFGKPWLFGLHQCQQKRIWSDEERVLFKLVAERLTDALNVANLRHALQESERRLAFALEGANDAIWDWDVEAASCYVSPRWASMAQQAVSRTSIATSPCPESIHAEDKAAFQAALLRHLQGATRQFEAEFRVHGQDAREYWILARGRPVEHSSTGAVKRIVGTYVDITARKRNETALRESQARMRQAQEIARIGCWEFDLKTRKPVWSDEFRQIIGMGENEEPSPKTLAQYLHPDDRDKFFQALSDAQADRKPYDLTCKIMHSDGEIRFVHSKARVFRDELGRPLRLLGIAQDITAHKKQEEALSNLLEENRRLTQACLRIQEQERVELARDLHDEFGQYLTAIELGANFANDRVGEQDAKLSAATADIMRATREALNSMRSITRRLRPKMLDCLSLEDTFRETLRSWQRHYSGIQYRFEATGDIDQLDEEIRVALYRILQESLTNVAKHAEAKCVAVRLNGAQHSISMEIEDDGKGMTEQDGAGIGLLGMKERAGALKGELSINGQANPGTRISVTLPLSSEPY